MLGFVSERWLHLCPEDAVSCSRFLDGFGGGPDIPGGGQTWGRLTSCDYCLSWQSYSVHLLSSQLMLILWIALPACHPCDLSTQTEVQELTAERVLEKVLCLCLQVWEAFVWLMHLEISPYFLQCLSVIWTDVRLRFMSSKSAHLPKGEHLVYIFSLCVRGKDVQRFMHLIHLEHTHQGSLSQAAPLPFLSLH